MAGADYSHPPAETAAKAPRLRLVGQEDVRVAPRPIAEPTSSPVPAEPQMRLTARGTPMPRMRQPRRVRMVRAGNPVTATQPRREPITGSDDPRWVLAVRVGASLQGSILPPERREQLLRVGQQLGLSAFDANLIIAMVQDQARRGYEPLQCATAAHQQLEMIRRPSVQSAAAQTQRWGVIAFATIALLLLEFLLLKAWWS